MPTITIPLDLSRGPVFPIRIHSAGSDKYIKTFAVLSISNYACKLSQRIAQQLNCPPLGRTAPVSYLGQTADMPTYQITVEVITGGLGRPLYRSTLPTIYATVTDLPDHVGLIIGLQLLHKGMLVCNRTGFSFCL